MKRSTAGFLTACSLVAATAAFGAQGCGSDSDSEFPEDGGTSSNGGASGGASGGGFSSGGSGGASGGTSGTTDGAACEAVSSRAEKLPLTLLIALDQSGSMGNHEGYVNLETRWKPVTAAMKAFWNNPSTQGITANMRLFPHDNTKSTSCKVAAYETPDVPLTALPNVAAFESKLVANPTNGFTPTRAVLEATAGEADALLDVDEASKVAVVLVTDGEPLYCDDHDPNNDIEGAVAEIENKRFPTYVMGIGGDANLEANVNALAQAGGTTAIFVETGNPGATESAITAALDAIRSKLASCDVSIPAPPAGKSFDREKVNVTLTSGSGQSTELGYDPTCAGPGWKYDDPNAPTRILLCPATCEPMKADPASNVDVAFGCTTRPAGPN